MFFFYNKSYTKKKRAKREKRIKKRKQTFSKYFLLFAQIETALLENLFDFCFHGELRASSNSVRSRKRLKKKESQKDRVFIKDDR